MAQHSMKICLFRLFRVFPMTDNFEIVLGRISVWHHGHPSQILFNHRQWRVSRASKMENSLNFLVFREFWRFLGFNCVWKGFRRVDAVYLGVRWNLLTLDLETKKYFNNLIVLRWIWFSTLRCRKLRILMVQPRNKILKTNLAIFSTENTFVNFCYVTELECSTKDLPPKPMKPLRLKASNCDSKSSENWNWITKNRFEVLDFKCRLKVLETAWSVFI